jgi:hypothetical protein
MIRTVPFGMHCESATIKVADATETAYLTVPSPRFQGGAPITVQATLKDLRSSMMSHHAQRGGDFHVCTKLYGSGGALSDDEYLRSWLHHLHTEGVGRVFVYALEPLPPALLQHS